MICNVLRNNKRVGKIQLTAVKDNISKGKIISIMPGKEVKLNDYLDCSIDQATIEEPFYYEESPSSRLSITKEESSDKGTFLTISALDADLKDVLTSIADNAGINLLFSDETLKKIAGRKVSLSINNMETKELIDNILRAQKLCYEFDGTTIIILTIEEADLKESENELKIVHLDYIDAQAAKNLLESMDFQPKLLKIEAYPSYESFFKEKSEEDNSSIEVRDEKYIPSLKTERIKRIKRYYEEEDKVKILKGDFLVLRGTKEAINIAHKALLQIDHPPRQIVLKNVIFEVARGEAESRNC